MYTVGGLNRLTSCHQGKKPCLFLRELEKQIRYDLDHQLGPIGKNLTIIGLVDRCLPTTTGVKPDAKMNYNFVRNILLNEPFGEKKIGAVKTSDAKLQNKRMNEPIGIFQLKLCIFMKVFF